MQVILNRRDKEQLVIKLYREGKTIREIASAAHLSFGDIGSIMRRIDGKVDDGIDLKNKSKDTQALFLFSSGNIRKRRIGGVVDLPLAWYQDAVL